LLCGLLLVGCSGSEDDESGSGIPPAELQGTWEFQSVTVNGAPQALGDALDWQPGTVAARMEIGSNGFSISEVDSGGQQTYYEAGFVYVDGNEMELNIFGPGGITEETIPGTYTLSGDTLIFTTVVEGDTIAITLTLMAGTGGTGGTGGEGGIVLDQENLLDGTIGGQGIGRFSDITGDPDPDGTSYDLQDAQTFVAGVSGTLVSIKVPIYNLNGATLPVTLELREVVSGKPDPDDGRVIGSVDVDASLIPSTSITDPSTTDPSTWPSFDVSRFDFSVVAGTMYCFSVRSISGIAFLYQPEISSSGYDAGAGFRRNRALGADWGGGTVDFGFQTFVAVP
jgi:hypothetical protein